MTAPTPARKVCVRCSIFGLFFFISAFFFVEPGKTQSYLTDHERKYSIHDDRHIIEFTYPFVFQLPIFFIDYEIQPALFILICFRSVHKMEAGTQENKTEDENEGFRQPKQEIVSSQETQ
jgi:hypothetical protein